MKGPAVDGVYLDHAATTPVDAQVLQAMLPYFTQQFGNPASVHRPGQQARRALEEAREQLADAVGARARQVIFTSGATEANNQALFGALQARPGGLIVGATEHPAVLSAARRLAAQGRPVEFVPPTADGTISVTAVEQALQQQAAAGGTALLALMYVNNETGVITPPAPMAALAHGFGALFLSDSVQALGAEAVALADMGADMITLSAHKVYGPKGVGALVLRPGLELPPLLAGGEQERGFRPGTHNLPAIVGFGVAAQRAVAGLERERAHLRGLQRTFEEAALQLPGVALNGAGALRSCKQSNVRVAGMVGETLLMLLDQAGVYVSAGSACAAGSLDPSHVLLAMGVAPDLAKASVRFSFGKQNSQEQVLRAAAALGQAVTQGRQQAVSA